MHENTFPQHDTRDGSFPPGNVRVHYVNYRRLSETGATSWGPRCLNEVELILAVREEFTFSDHDHGKTAVLHPGEVLMIPPGLKHTFSLRGDQEKAFFSCIHMEPPAGPAQSSPDAFRITRLPQEDAILELFRRADHLFHNTERVNREKLEYTVTLIWMYLQTAQEPAREDLRLDAMLIFLDERLATHPGRLELAREFHLSPQRVNALFREKLGISPTEYVHRELAERGYDLIHFGRLTVKEAAAELGFDKACYFSRIFRKVFGFPPSSLL